jgi:hypothetical protein
MRILSGAQTRLGQTGVGQQLDRLAIDIVCTQRFSYLKADPPHRVQVGHRILWHVADPTAPDGPELTPGGGGEVDAVELDATRGDAPARRKQPENRRGSGGLPRTRLTDDRHSLPRAHLEVHAAHRRITVAEADFESGDAEQWQISCTHKRHVRDDGSRASRNTSPMIIKASTVIASAPAG